MLDLDEGLMWCTGCLFVREADGRAGDLCAECASAEADCASCSETVTRGALDEQGYCHACAESIAQVPVQDEPRAGQ